jgi:hypothetical protein
MMSQTHNQRSSNSYGLHNRTSEEYIILIIPEKEYDLTVSVAEAGKVQNWV